MGAKIEGKNRRQAKIQRITTYNANARVDCVGSEFFTFWLVRTECVGPRRCCFSSSRERWRSGACCSAGHARRIESAPYRNRHLGVGGAVGRLLAANIYKTPQINTY